MRNLGMPTVCIKCGNSLNEKDKEIGLPLCQDCVGSLTDNVIKKIRGLGEKKIEDDVDNFANFIFSSGQLLRLNDITIIQCCFNIFMKKTTELEDENLSISEKIFEDSIRFIEKELDNIEDKKNSGKNPGSQFLSMFDEIIKSGMKSGNGSEDNIIEEKDNKKENKQEKKDNKKENKQEKKDNKKEDKQ